MATWAGVPSARDLEFRLQMTLKKKVKKSYPPTCWRKPFQKEINNLPFASSFQKKTSQFQGKSVQSIMDQQGGKCRLQIIFFRWFPPKMGWKILTLAMRLQTFKSLFLTGNPFLGGRFLKIRHSNLNHLENDKLHPGIQPCCKIIAFICIYIYIWIIMDISYIYKIKYIILTCNCITIYIYYPSVFSMAIPIYKEDQFHYHEALFSSLRTIGNGLRWRTLKKVNCGRGSKDVWFDLDDLTFWMQGIHTYR